MADITEQQMLDYFKSKGYTQSNYGVLGALGGAYGALTSGDTINEAYGQSADAAQQQAQALQQQMQQMPTLASMYGQDSSYSRQLQATLAAKDAASGRNSQYGNRAVQLQAALADKGSQYAAQQAQMANQYNQAITAANTARTQASVGQQQVRAQQLGSLFNVADKTGLLSKANNSLAGLYSQYFPENSGPTSGMTQDNFQARQGYDIPWSGSNPTAEDYSYGGPSTGLSNQSYQTTGAPTDSSNMYYQPQWDE